MAPYARPILWAIDELLVDKLSAYFVSFYPFCLASAISHLALNLSLNNVCLLNSYEW